MFASLNRFISRFDEPQNQQGAPRSAFGFQVLRNSNDELPLEPWFDFVIGINGRNIDNPDPNLFAAEIRNCAGSSVNLGLWSAKGQKLRSLYAQIPAEQPSLGLSLQWTPVSTTEDIWHILDVSPNSPADAAGLLSHGDYIIGSPEGLLKGETGLGELVEDYLVRPMRLFVYNHDYNVTRLVTIQPSRSWGGSGALGCVLGYGALHRIPAPLEEPPQAPGEVMFDSFQQARLSSDGEPGPSEPTAPQPPQYLIPADLPVSSPSVTTPSAPPGSTRRTRPHHHGARTDMDAYFAEGEEKSRKEDRGVSSKPTSSDIAPPPKGGPPRAGTPLKSSPKSETPKIDDT